jgi:hypothetical protein
VSRRRTKSEIAEAKLKVAKHRINGLELKEIATVENRSLDQVKKDSTRLNQTPAEAQEEDFLELQGLMSEVRSHQKSGKPLSLACVDRLARLLELRIRLRGTAAPTKSLHVNVEADAQKLVGYRKFVVATRHLDEAQISTVYDFIAAIPARPPVELVIPDVDLDALQLKGETECES